MISFLRRLLEFFGLIPRSEIIAFVSPDHPDHASLPAGRLHIVGGPGYRKWAYLKCPCGCGAPIMLALSQDRRPSWTVAIDWLDRPTIKPSVWQTDGCFSHFWITAGRFDWVRDTSKPPVRAAAGGKSGPVDFRS